MKAAAQFVAQLFSTDEQQQQQQHVEALASEYDSISMEELPTAATSTGGSDARSEFAAQAIAYYCDVFRTNPAHAGDLLLGIAAEPSQKQWWIPVDHPIAMLLEMNSIVVVHRSGSLLRYGRSKLTWGQQSLAAILGITKQLDDQGALWSDSDDDDDDGADDDDE